MTTSHDNYDEKFFAPLIAIEDKHFWFRSRNQLIFNLIDKYALNSQSYGMEIGCGTGNVLTFLQRKFPAQRIIGVDLFREGLQFAGKRGAHDLVQANIEQAPFKKDFSWIGLFDIIEHLEDDVLVLRKISGLLQEHGFLFVSVPAFPVLWSYFDVAGKHKRRYTVKTLEQSFQAAGLEMVFASYTNVLIFPILWIMRRFFQSCQAPETLSETQIDAKTNAELRIVPLVNEVLAFLLGVEGKLIQSGMRMPFGTSLIAVARPK